MKIKTMLITATIFIAFTLKFVVQTCYYQSAEMDYIDATFAEKNKHSFDMASLEFDKQLNKAKANSFRIERDSLAKEARRKTAFADKLTLFK